MRMELKSSSPKSCGLSPPDYVSDPEDKEISDDDDDDRNHKHRRRETRSQSPERDPLEQGVSQPYRKRNRPFENGQSGPQSHCSFGKDFSRFEKRRPNFSRFGEHGFGRGRGRDYQRVSRFGSVDVASQMGHPGSISSAMFSGRGLSNVLNAQSASWSGFGLIPAIANGAVDAINPLGLPGILRPPLNPSLNIGMQRQRCRDFEERGFCLRGDMCPMEHGINRIVVEDVQSLSQFNLPVSLSNAHMLGTSPASGFMPSVSASSSTLINSRGLHSRTGKSVVDDDALSLNGASSGAVSAIGADVYDPDQPLWNNDGHKTSTPLLGLQPPISDEPDSLMNADVSDRLVRNSGMAAGSQSTSSTVWGRLSNSKLKEKFGSRTKPPEYQESRQKEICEASGSTQRTSHIGKQKNGVAFGPETAASMSKLQNDSGCDVRKPSQRAQRTLFVNCVPLKDNKKENLLSHFRKFGEVIDVYIPANSERAFVQFSKREDAERALKAPDAVMGSRFIKLWWANRDSIADEGMSSGNNLAVTPRSVPAASRSPQPIVVCKGKENVVTAGNDFKPAVENCPKAPPQVQKKMESLEHLKEELRKKQEMLDLKRSEFRQKLEKLSKQATGVKSEVPTGQAAKIEKIQTSTDAPEAGNTNSADAVTSGPSSKGEVLMEKTVNAESINSPRSKTNTASVLKDPPSLKQTVRPMAAPGAFFPMNRYKLDNRPTTFRLDAPLPEGLANVAALRDHFSIYGEISTLEIEELGEEDRPDASNESKAMRNCSARVSFTTRHSAEKAFLSGRSWRGQNLQLKWVTSSISGSSRSSGESSSALKGASNAEVQSAERTSENNYRPSSDPQEGNSSPRKLKDEISGDSSRSACVAEEHSTFEADEPENKDMEAQEEAGANGDILTDKDLRAGLSLLVGGRELPRGKIC